MKQHGRNALPEAQDEESDLCFFWCPTALTERPKYGQTVVTMIAHIIGAIAIQVPESRYAEYAASGSAAPLVMAHHCRNWWPLANKDHL